MDTPPLSAPPDAFGRAARDYERGRPSWPEPLLDEVAGELGLGPESTVLDLAAGTGKLTRQLVPRFGRVVAVEPDEAMLAVLAEVVPEAEPLAGSAEAIPLPEDAVDAVFVAEAFHWFASDATVAEIVRVLRSRGGLVVLWNTQNRHDPPFPEEANRLIDEAFDRGGAPGMSKILSGDWRGPLAAAPFEELRARQLDREESISRDEWIAYLLSVSSIASQPGAARVELAERLRELAPDIPYRRLLHTDLYWTRLSG
ncbi:MAG TPA: class I SAM-dependent methyltransferase [Gaiellaceae bacterium]|jgi:SAM-dependent methyltransferase|nr:class I SAM-dependent methyltransferase [Gaiellaceae bacterium]